MYAHLWLVIWQMQNTTLSLSYVEVYKENVMDLLNNNKLLTIHENANKGIYVESTRTSFSNMTEFSSVFIYLWKPLDFGKR